MGEKMNKLHHYLYYKTPEWIKISIVVILFGCSYAFNIEDNTVVTFVFLLIGVLIGYVFRKPKH